MSRALFLSIVTLVLATTSPASAIQHGVPATAYPEAVVVTGGLPCSGVLISPTVVLTAGHCGAPQKSYDVTAPHALDASGNAQSAHGSHDWTTFTGQASASSDVRLVYLDAPITLASYPALASGPVAAGTRVVDLGRALDGAIQQNIYASAPVTIQGDASGLGFPFNYEAIPDISETGDSGGPIELADGSHTVVALVDTDTVEQSMTVQPPIDMFVRIDLVRNAIEQHLAPPDVDAGTGSASPPSGGSCNVIPRAPPREAPISALLAVATLLAVRLRGRGCSPPKRAGIPGPYMP
jgi:hypothetical protein